MESASGKIVTMTIRRRDNGEEAEAIDGYSRYMVHWDIRKSMREWEIEVILQRAREKYPKARPRIITTRFVCTAPSVTLRRLTSFWERR